MTPTPAPVWPPVSLHGGHTTAADGAATASDMIAAARAAGFEVFGLSEHFYRPPEPRYAYALESMSRDYGRATWPGFVDDALAARAALGPDPGLRVLVGAEVEYLPGHRDWTVAELARWPLDFTVLSVHFVEVDGETFPFDFSRGDWLAAAARAGGEAPLFRRYWEHVVDAVSWPVGDVLGHADIVKIHASGPVRDPAVDALVDQALALCAARGTALDLNARGLAKPCAEVYPSREILRRALAAGVAIVPGDDSHRPEEVGRNLARAAAWAREAGYREVSLPPRLGARRWTLAP
jgi:histidinol-phosphatase (PHP family)